MLIVPITDTFSQTLNVVLAAQNCKLEIYQKFTGLFIDVYVNDALIIGGVICENLNRIVRSLYLGFVGDLMFQDLEGDTSPVSPGLGSRYILLYLTADDLHGEG